MGVLERIVNNYRTYRVPSEVEDLYLGYLHFYKTIYPPKVRLPPNIQRLIDKVYELGGTIMAARRIPYQKLEDLEVEVRRLNDKYKDQAYRGAGVAILGAMGFIFSLYVEQEAVSTIIQYAGGAAALAGLTHAIRSFSLVADIKGVEWHIDKLLTSVLSGRKDQSIT